MAKKDVQKDEKTVVRLEKLGYINRRGRSYVFTEKWMKEYTDALGIESPYGDGELSRDQREEIAIASAILKRAVVPLDNLKEIVDLIKSKHQRANKHPLPKKLEVAGLYSDPKQGILMHIATKYNALTPPDVAMEVVHEQFHRQIDDMQKEGTELPYFGAYEFF